MNMKSSHRCLRPWVARCVKFLETHVCSHRPMNGRTSAPAPLASVVDTRTRVVRVMASFDRREALQIKDVLGLTSRRKDDLMILVSICLNLASYRNTRGQQTAASGTSKPPGETGTPPRPLGIGAPPRRPGSTARRACRGHRRDLDPHP
jgi:hypothetical protein